jgi:hypothetical protein
MNNSTIIRVFAEAVGAGVLAGIVFVWPVPTLLSAKDTISVISGVALSIVVALGATLYVNRRIKNNATTPKQ